MSIIKTYYGLPSYTISNDKVSVFITIQGGHLTATFKVGRREINPFFIAPWWNEAKEENIPEVLKVLRGDFFCLPFGGNDEPFQGVQYPLHGATSNENWELVGYNDTGNKRELVLKLELEEDGGEVDKYITVHENQPIIYQRHVISGVQGRMSVGHHPIMKIPGQKGMAILDISWPIAGFTPPVPIEEPENKGYSLLKCGQEITNMTKVQTVEGSYLNLTQCPITLGYEDIAAFISDTKKEFTYSVLSLPEKGYLYFQLKNPKVLSQTLLWMSNGGRHYPPWNGRVRCALGIEEVTSFFHYGIKPSVEENLFLHRGYNTFIQFNEDRSQSIKLIMGLIKIDKDFKGVKDIIMKDNSTITILGKGGERIDVPCNANFLKD